TPPVHGTELRRNRMDAFKRGIVASMMTIMLATALPGCAASTIGQQATPAKSPTVGNLAGILTEFPVRTTNSGLDSITAGPDGNLWFTEHDANKIGRITSSGDVTEFAIPSAETRVALITSGPDGNLWFAEPLANKIGRITPGGAVA